MTLRHQSKILLVMSATCDHVGIQLAIPKAHPIPNTTARPMDGLWRRSIFHWQKVLGLSLTPQDHDRVFTSCFHYKLQRKGGEFDKCQVRLVVQGKHMRQKGEDSVGDHNDSFRPVPAASGFHTILSLATQQNMFTDYVDISQTFVQGELLPGDGHNGKVYNYSPPGYDEVPLYVYRLLKPLMACPLQPELDTPP